MSQDMKDQLSKITPYVKKAKTPSTAKAGPEPVKKDLHDWIDDGVDHVNIWKDTKTELGVYLDFNAYYLFHHPILGEFRTMAGFWHYITAVRRDDNLRHFSGINLRKLIHETPIKKIPNYRAIIMDAVWIRIKQLPKLLALVKNNKLPYDCYYVDHVTKIRMQPKFHNWMSRGMTEIQKAVDLGREPNFKFLMDNHSVPLYDPIIPQYVKNAMEAEKTELAAQAAKQKERATIAVVTPVPDFLQESAVSDISSTENTVLISTPVAIEKPGLTEEELGLLLAEVVVAGESTSEENNNTVSVTFDLNITESETPTVETPKVLPATEVV